MLSQILDILFGGILLGAVYAVVALGLSLTMGIMGVVNVSHSAFVMLGSFLALEMLERLDVDPIASFFIALPLSILIGFLFLLLVLGSMMGLFLDYAGGVLSQLAPHA